MSGTNSNPLHPRHRFYDNNRTAWSTKLWRMLKVCALLIPALAAWYTIEFWDSTPPVNVTQWIESNNYHHSTYSTDLSAMLPLKEARNATVSVVLPARNEADYCRLDRRNVSPPVNVTKWQESNNYHHSTYSTDLSALLRLKEARNATVSVVLPARNEADTVGSIVEMLRDSLIDGCHPPLIDQLIVIDSDSTDNTSEVSSAAGATVHRKHEILPSAGDNKGKGETLWKSLVVATGDIIVWLDADVSDNGPHFVTGLVGALLNDPEVVYAKGYYERPLVRKGVVQPGEGGRVTELTVKPLLAHLYPQFVGFYQPLSGEYAIRRSVAIEMPFFINYGVEMGLLIDITNAYGLDRVVQVNLDLRTHKNRGLKHLKNMAHEIITVMMKRAGMANGELVDTLGRERPPIKAYLEEQ